MPLATMAELWVVRHGETPWSREGRHTGRTDIGLTPYGERQSELLGRRLCERPFSLVLTSPLGRARETCKLAGYGSVAVEDADLYEWDYGAYEGLTTEQIRSRSPDWDVWSGEIPQGETVDQVRARADRAIAKAMAAPGDVLVFAHAHFLRLLGARWLGLAPTDGRLFGLHPASVSILSREREHPVMTLWNDVSHLVRGQAAK